MLSLRTNETTAPVMMHLVVTDVFYCTYFIHLHVCVVNVTVLDDKDHFRLSVSGADCLLINIVIIHCEP